jgi:hypothetical protein
MKTVIVWLMMIHTPAMPETPEHHLAGYAFAAYENEMLCEVKAMRCARTSRPRAPSA